MFTQKTLLGSALAIATLCSTQTLFAQNYYVAPQKICHFAPCRLLD
jgi:hypothetical protein